MINRYSNLLEMRAPATARTGILETSSSNAIIHKTGGTGRGYCSQSVRHKTHVKPTKQLPVDEVVESAEEQSRVSPLCMGAAWRGNKKKAFGRSSRWFQVNVKAASGHLRCSIPSKRANSRTRASTPTTTTWIRRASSIPP